MDSIVKIIIIIIDVLFCLVASAALGILLMIYGWGLTPASWPWIIGCIVANWALLIVMSLFRALLKD